MRPRTRRHGRDHPGLRPGCGVVFGLDAHTGAVLWDFKTAGTITGSPIVAGDTMYVVSHDGTLYAVSRAE